MDGQNLEVILGSSGSNLSTQEHCQSVTIQSYLKWFILIAFYCQIKKCSDLVRRDLMYVCMY